MTAITIMAFIGNVIFFFWMMTSLVQFVVKNWKEISAEAKKNWAIIAVGVLANLLFLLLSIV